MSAKLLLTEGELQSIAGRVDLGIFTGKSILITGGTGLVGSYLVEALCRILDQHLRDFKFLTFENRPLLKTGKFFGFDYIIHAASPASPTKYKSAEELLKINCGVLEQICVAGAERILFISAGEIYGAEAPTPIPENYVGLFDLKSKRSAYPLAKIKTEKLGQELCAKLGIQFRIARLFHTFGPGLRKDDGRSFADFLWNCATNQIPILRSKGLDVRSFLYLEDSIVAIFKILSSDTYLGPVNIGSSNATTILEFARRSSMIAGLEGKVSFDIVEDNYIHSPNKIMVPDITRLQAYGWKQEYDLDSSIEMSLGWIKEKIRL